MPVQLAVDGRVLDDRYHGIGRVTAALLRELTSYPEFEITLFVRSRQTSSRIDVATLVEDCQLRIALFDLPLTSPVQWAMWPFALKRAGIDVALFPYHLGAAIFGAGKRYSVLHDCILETDRLYAPNLMTRLMYKALTSVVVRRTRPIVPSQATADEVRRHYGLSLSKWQIIPWGVSAEFARDDARLSTERAGLPSTYYLHVGARRPHKNIEVLVDAMALAGPDRHLVLVGTEDPRFPDRVSRLAWDRGVSARVTSLANVPDAELHQLYAGASAFVYPSTVEGFGLPLLEAMAAGVPVIASDIAVFREVAGRDAALFVPPDRPADWAAAMQSLDDPGRRTALIDAGHERVRVATWSAAGAALAAALHQP